MVVRLALVCVCYTVQKQTSLVEFEILTRVEYIIQCYTLGKSACTVAWTLPGMLEVVALTLHLPHIGCLRKLSIQE